MAVHGRSVTQWSSVPISPSLLRNGHVFDVQGMAVAIREALSAHGFRGSSVVFAFPGLRSSTRVLSLPSIPQRQLDAVVNREARRLMAFSPETSYLFWQSLRGSPAQLRVFVLTVPREPLVSLVEAVRLAGARPRAVDLKPLALIRAVSRDRAIIASVELNSIELVIVVDGLPQLMRGVFLGDEGITSQMVGARLVDEMNRTISFYDDTHKEQPLGRDVPVYLVGDVASPDLADMVKNVTGRQVPALQSPIQCPSEMPLAPFAVNLGLALKRL